MTTITPLPVFVPPSLRDQEVSVILDGDNKPCGIFARRAKFKAHPIDNVPHWIHGPCIIVWPPAAHEPRWQVCIPRELFTPESGVGSMQSYMTAVTVTQE